MEIGVDIAHIAGVKLTANELGRVGQKYILDPDLRRILRRAVLGADKMIPCQHQELFLITSVV